MNELDVHVVVKKITKTVVGKMPGHSIELQSKDYSNSVLIYFSTPEDAIEWLEETKYKIESDMREGEEGANQFKRKSSMGNEST